MKTNIFLALIGIALSSCTSFVTIHKTMPPDLNIPANSDFLFVDRFMPEELDFNNQNKIDVFYKGRDKFVQGLKAGFDTCKVYHLQLSDTTLPSHSAHEPAYNLKPDIVEHLCSHSYDYLLTLDNYNLYFDQDVEVVENEDGSKDRTAYYDLVLNTYITIYDKEGGIVDKLKDEKRIEHDERSVISGLLAVGPSMGKADKHAELISDALGREFIQKFFPYEVSDLRQFYSTKPFVQAFHDFERGNWQAVEKELMKYTENPDPKIVGRASYNLSVLYENLGKKAEQDYWYQNAVDKLGSKIPDPAMGSF